MRTVLMMFALLLVIGGGFYAYVSMQAETPRKPGPISDTGVRQPQDLDPDAERSGVAGPGARPWVKVYDAERRLSYRFRAQKYAPERAGRIEVEGPEADFFQYVRDDKEPGGIRTQRIQLLGKTGEVEVQQGPQASAEKGFEKGSSGPPKRGLLNDVVIKVFNRNGDESPAMNIHTPNVAFDNESFEIATRGYRTPEGVDVPADQVPIEATGDYNFRGRGLAMRWNDVDGRLEHLDIAHGDYLQIMKPGGLGQDKKAPAKTPATGPIQAASPRPAMPLHDDQNRPVALAQAGPKSATPTPKASGPRSQPANRSAGTSARPPYRATFERDVRVSQGQMNVAETQLAAADLMYIDFRSGSDGEPSTRPAGTPSSKPAAMPQPSVVPQLSPATTNSASEPAQPSGQDTKSTTQPTEQPIIVRWAGKLRIVPLESPGDLPMPLASGQSVVRLVGQQAPVRLSRELNRIDCTAADYFSNDGSVMLRGSDRHGPVVLRQLPDPAVPAGQSREATIQTQTLNYNGTSKVAVLNGRSNAVITLPAESAAAAADQSAVTVTPNPATRPAGPQVVTARWNREGRLTFKDGLTGEMSFDRADFAGDVDVVHPQLALKSQDLALLFQESIRPAESPKADTTKATTRPSSQLELKQVIATTDVWADLVDGDGRKQTVTTDRLTVDTASDGDGRFYPRLITAVGNAHAFDEKQSLRAGGVELTMVPAPQPSTRAAKTAPAKQPASGKAESVAVELKSMRAWDGVLVSSADGATAAGQTMNVDVVAGNLLATIMGREGTAGAAVRPEDWATVTDAKGNTISGPKIDFDPKRQWAMVAGRGAIRAVQADPAPQGDATTQPAVARRTNTPRFVDINWDRQAELDGGSDRMVVEGPVRVSSTDADGTENTARGRRAVIELAARPATDSGRVAPSTTRPAGKAPLRSATRPSVVPGLAGGDMDLLKDKAVSAVNLEGDAVVNSTLADAAGILRQFELKADRVRYEAGQPATATPTTKPAAPLAMGDGGNGKLIVPGAGTMIYRDHRPASKPATRPAGEAVVATAKPSPEPGVTSDAPGQARGATAFQWKQSLTYDQRLREANMTGDVVIVHQPDGTGELPVRVTGDRGLAIFEPKAISRPATRPTTRPTGEPAMTMQLKRLMMAGNLLVVRGDSQLTADRMVYDPATGWMTAHGTTPQPATYTGKPGEALVLADEIHWNAQSWLTKFVGVRVRSGAGQVGVNGR